MSTEEEGEVVYYDEASGYYQDAAGHWFYYEEDGSQVFVEFVEDSSQCRTSDNSSSSSFSQVLTPKAAGIKTCVTSREDEFHKKFAQQLAARTAGIGRVPPPSNIDSIPSPGPASESANLNNITNSTNTNINNNINKSENLDDIINNTRNQSDSEEDDLDFGDDVAEVVSNFLLSRASATSSPKSRSTNSPVHNNPPVNAAGSSSSSSSESNINNIASVSTTALAKSNNISIKGPKQPQLQVSSNPIHPKQRPPVFSNPHKGASDSYLYEKMLEAEVIKKEALLKGGKEAMDQRVNALSAEYIIYFHF